MAGIRQDPDLEILHGDPDFERIVGEQGYVVALEQARAAVSQRDIERALEHVRTAVARGYDNWHYMVSPRGFVNLHGNPEFEAIVAELKARRPGAGP